jgi:hypothetical protein
MIEIHLQQLGMLTRASCTFYLPGGREDHVAVTAPSGAKALTSLIEKLCKDHSGEEWVVSGDPPLSGKVARARTRRPVASRKRRAEQSPRLFFAE